MAIFQLNHEQRYYREKIGPTVTVGISTAASTASAALKPGRYRVISDVACWVRQGAAATSGSCLLPANTVIYMNVDFETPETGGVAGNWGGFEGSDNTIAGLVVTGAAGTLYITKVSDLLAAT